ncbi:ABC transporter ATP-binding protein [Paenibacillus odorifer]|uniref:ABC transporter ATP-binding protein n=1 Tax=Paenibacillus odorifer TaxID=189426 RepID=UPI00148270D7|nr:ABC transporter ATP-binding protein [Paenibacillus odorifer]
MVKTRDCSKNVDTIYVMYNGEIAEVGDYQDLELHKWIYANMYALQSSWYK